jgi:hypothetical protein
MPPNQPDSGVRLIDSINSGSRIPASRLVRDNPKAAAMMSKLTVNHRTPIQGDIMQQQGAGINAAGLRAVAHDGMQNVNDAETVRQLLSDTDLAEQILTSVILSPQDMMGVKTSYVAELTHWNIPHETKASLTNSVREYFEEVYKIKPRLSSMLGDILFKRGCWPAAVLPENAIDDMIHGNGSISMESFKGILKPNGHMESLGILGPVDAEMPKEIVQTGYRSSIGLALEHLMTHQPNKSWRNDIAIPYEHDKKVVEFNTGITVTDNLDILKMPNVHTKLRAQKTRDIIGRASSLSAESIAARVGTAAQPYVNIRPQAIVSQVFHKGRQQQTLIREIKTQDKLKRRSIGMPLEIHFPSESVIPVHVPNQPSKQIGYFVLLDPEGNPINRGQGINHYRELGMSLQNNSFASSMIQRAGLAMSDNSDYLTRSNSYATMGQMYGQMLERDLMQRLRNGLVGGNVSIAGNDEVYRLMLSRSLANQQTQILYVPSEYMTYIAFDYHTNGTGKSLLDNTKIIDSMQAMLMVGTVMGALRNSVGRTHVDLQLDPDTPDPWKAIETTMGEIMRINGNGFPLGTIDPLDIKDGLLRSQFEFSFSGHPKLPDMKVDFTEKNTNYQPPDPKLSEDLRKRRLMAFYLTPEQVDAASGADFATSVSNNSTLLSKRAMVLQVAFTEQVSQHLRKHAINSADLIDELVDIINGSYEDILKEFKEDEEIEMFDGTKVTKEELKDDPLVKGQFIRELIEDFIGGFSMTLPEPDTTKLGNLEELYKKQSDLIDEALKAWVSQDMMDPAIVGEELSSHISVIFQQLKSYMLRNWQIKHGLLPELNQLTSRDEDGEVELDVSEIISTHNASMMEIFTNLLSANKKVKEKSAKALEKAGVQDSAASYGGDDTGGGYGNDGGDGMGGDLDLGMPNMDLDDAAAGGDPANPEAEPEADPENPDAEPAEGSETPANPEEGKEPDGSAPTEENT